MGNENVVKKEKRLDENHGSLKAVYIFDFFGGIATLFYSIPVFVLLSSLGDLPKYAQVIIWLIFVYGIIAMIYCIFIRNKLLRRGHKTVAVLLNLLFGIGWPIEFIAGIILACSNLYVTVSETEDEIKYENPYKEVQAIYDYYLKNDKQNISLNPRINELKKQIIDRKEELTSELNSLNNMEKRCGLTDEQMFKKGKILCEIKQCDASIDLCLGKNPIFDDVCQNLEINDLSSLIEEAKKLPLEKQEIFNEHKKYYDDGIYSKGEFEQKVSFLFSE